MKKLIVLMFLMFAACSPSDGNGRNARKLGSFEIIIIDGCEYVEYDAGAMETRVYSLTHKGNCKFCKQRNKGE